MYHRLFTWMLELERSFGEREPSFQYTVTTTTPPPPQLAKEPYVRLTPDARSDIGLMLKRRLGIV